MEKLERGLGREQSGLNANWRAMADRITTPRGSSVARTLLRLVKCYKCPPRGLEYAISLTDESK